MSKLTWSNSQSFTSAGAGALEVIAINVPWRGEIRAYSLLAADGGATGNFTAGLYTSKRDKLPNSALPLDAFKLVTFDQSSNAVANTVLAYSNRDGSPSNNYRVIYLHLTRSGGSKDFVFSITVDQPRNG